MKLKVAKASEQHLDYTPQYKWEVNTIDELLTKIKECGHAIILDENGLVTIYDDYVE